MIHDERDDREELALDALVGSFFCISPDDEPDLIDDLEILDEADRKALAALGDDLVDRLLAARRPAPAPPLQPADPPAWSDFGMITTPPELTALHRGDEQLTAEAREEIERQRRELLEADDEECEE